ncbi:hypothetical protein L2E82_34165 [Cichorium intybus]|uniref:Uncharacterized protein n=1 Tax=Cichorium intybus TaxID=13427 RepID=A0ACB9BLN3_CICIN|nr:hypothetical protein L2E82_34165 [Cichorium intybus]
MIVLKIPSNQERPNALLELSKVIVVDNLPVVPREKFEKLEGVVRKIYIQLGVMKENGLWMPVEEETGKIRGYRFIEYNTSQVDDKEHELYDLMMLLLQIQQ